MWNKPTKAQLKRIPKLYATETLMADKVIYLHFYLGGCDWYIAEYDREEELFFGFAILNGDQEMAEWGYISYQELQDTHIILGEVETDMGWEVRKASEVEKIMACRVMNLTSEVGAVK